MNISLRTAAALAFAATLTACGGGGGSTPSLPTTPQAAPHGPAGISPFALVENGSPIAGTHIMPSTANGGLLAMARTRSSGGNNLIWGGGPVQRDVKIYLVLWKFGSNDPYGEGTRLTNFIKGLGGSQWMSSMNQYYDSTGNVNNDASFGGTWSDNTDSIPSRPSQSAVAAEAARAAAHFGNYGVDAMYFIALAKGHDPSGFKTQWCAFHSTTSASGHTIAYTDFPYTSDAGANCGANSVNSGSAGTEDGVTIVGGHEIAEGVTDPQAGNGWVDSSGSEIGDKCAWVSLKNTSFSTGTFPTQPLWSNSAGGCVQ